MNKKALFFCVFILSIATLVSAADVVKIGLTAPLDVKPLGERDPYWKQGLDQKRAADMAVEEINAAGGTGEIRKIADDLRGMDSDLQNFILISGFKVAG